MQKAIRILLVIIILVLAVLLVGRGAYALKEYQIANDEEKRRELYDKILDAATVKPTEISVNYNHPTSNGSPLVFGAVQYPNWHSEGIWEELQEIGITSMRTDFYLEHMVPFNTSIEDYKNNKNDVQNINTWQHDFIKSRQDAYNTAKKLGMKTIGIVSYAPDWLTALHNFHSVPKDWGVYKDLVRKAYKIHRNNIDYVEIWNEPTHKFFLDNTGSGLTTEQAYTEIFYNAAMAIREVDEQINDGKKVLIGGPVGDNPQDTSLLEAILKDNRTRKYIDFISYHNYTTEEPSWNPYKEILKKYNAENYPIYITEWNYNSENKKDSPYKTADPAIMFTSNKLIDFLKMGVAGANYYSLLEIVQNDPKRDTEFLGFYKWNGQNTELLPQAKSWRILSKDMALGKGKSDIYTPFTDDENINSIGFTNTNDEQGLAIVNASPSAKMINMRFNNLAINNYAKIQVYYASGSNNAKVPVYEGTVKITNGNTTFNFYLPKETVMAVKLIEDKEWFNLFNFK
jgi:hypothetical protein